MIYIRLSEKFSDMEKFNKPITHRDLDLWKVSKDFSKELYELTEKFPKEEKYGLISQIRRAGNSICLNIAEGASRGHTKEFIQFLYISQGSCSEIEAQLELALNLNFVESIESELNKIKRIKQMIHGLIRSLNR